MEMQKTKTKKINGKLAISTLYIIPALIWEFICNSKSYIPRVVHAFSENIPKRRVEFFKRRRVKNATECKLNG